MMTDRGAILVIICHAFNCSYNYECEEYLNKVWDIVIETSWLLHPNYRF